MAGNSAADPSRRALLRGAAGAGVAGLAVSTLAGLPAAAALAAPRPAPRPAGPGSDQSASQAPQDVIVRLRSVGSGEMEIFSGTRVTRIRDVDIASRLVRAIS